MVIRRRTLLLPAPLGPVMHTNSPLLIENETSSRASWSRYRRCTW
jgi:hypothetical protein